eukprot:gene3695-2212_t
MAPFDRLLAAHLRPQHGLSMREAVTCIIWTLDSAAVEVRMTYINYGSSDDVGTACDPVKKVYFFNPKVDPDRSYQLAENSLSLLFSPRAYEERTILVFFKESAGLHLVQQAIQDWKTEHGDNQLCVPIPTYNASPGRT